MPRSATGFYPGCGRGGDPSPLARRLQRRGAARADGSPAGDCGDEGRGMALSRKLSSLSSVWLALAVGCASPSAPAPAPDAGAPRITPDVVYGHKDGMALFYDVFSPQKPNGAAV